MFNIIGKKVGRLIALRFAYKNLQGRHYWLFKCDCGKEKIIRKDSVNITQTVSCGCYCKENNKKLNTVHGYSKKDRRFYGIWRNLVQRCLNKKDKGFKKYGGRGIKVCNRWLKFENFRDDLYQLYLEHVKKFGEKDTTIERIDNDGDYKLKNCRWATYKEQANNRRTSCYIIYKGKKMTIRQWEEELDFKKGTLRARLNIYKIPVEIAFLK